MVGVSAFFHGQGQYRHHEVDFIRAFGKELVGNAQPVAVVARFRI